MINETTSKALRSCLVVIAIGCLVGIAFVAGYVSGSRVTATPVAAELDTLEEGEAFPTPPSLSTPAQVTRVITATPAEVTPEPISPEQGPADRPSQEATPSFDLYWEVWELIEGNFYGELPSEQERLYGAIRGALRTLDDDYTAFIEPEVAAVSRSNMNGSFEGIGAVVRLNDADQLEIVRPLEGQPAELAGLREGDVVLAVDGESIEGIGLYEAIALIRGPRGSAVVLTIWRPGGGDPFDVEIIRDRIPLPTIESEMLEGDIGYIWLYEFNAQATTLLREAIEGLQSQGATGLILDLRDNPGGFLSQAVSVADEFLPDGVILYERGRDLEEVFESTDEGLGEEIPLVVLINGGSASASEIVAGAIQDRGRAPLIGETSLGKGSVQQPRTLSDGSELRITIARWFTPDGRAIHGNGLEPDIVVPLTEEDYENDRDPQLERAIDYLIAGE
jgi:carboxyl-terminal processing protease